MVASSPALADGSHLVLVVLRLLVGQLLVVPLRRTIHLDLDLLVLSLTDGDDDFFLVTSPVSVLTW